MNKWINFEHWKEEQELKKKMAEMSNNSISKVLNKNEKQ